jgi:hypothetical protein
MKFIFVSIFVALCLSQVAISVDANLRLTSSYFDSRGTITNVLSPSSLIINGEEVELEGINPSGLYSSTYAYLVEDLKYWLIGKDVFVKGKHVYFDLNGAYNSISINEMIQQEISGLRYEQYYDWQYNNKFYYQVF